ncbi:MAG: matrixin family metalloprotease [Bdellovibrionaceae bacterium]|nr:matrixin family metalloprotease [Pseudobdellovibrionaceae bacterium]
MWKYAGLILIPLIAFAMQACAPKAQEDCGFVQNVYGERISWKGQYPITMYVHESVPESFYPAIQAAAKTWQDASGKPLFNIVTSQKIYGPPNPIKDSSNIIYFLKTWEEDKTSEQARTSIYWIGDQVKEADVRINGKFTYYWDQDATTAGTRASSINIEALVIHELGHVLGLKHKDSSNSVMATYLSNNSDRVNIADTDKSALQCEY